MGGPWALKMLSHHERTLNHSENRKHYGTHVRAELNRYNALKEELASQLDIINTAFIKAGRILSQIRDERLYRGEFDTFEQFCRSMVGKDKRYVNRIIQAHGVIE